jgi:hypothetical protein
MVSNISGFEKTNIVGFKIEGSVSSDDIKKVDEAIKAKLELFPKVRILTDMTDHKGWTVAGFAKDFLNKFKYANDIERSAVIADDSWDDAIELADQLTSGQMQRFSPRLDDEAIEWIRHGALKQD